MGAETPPGGARFGRAWQRPPRRTAALCCGAMSGSDDGQAARLPFASATGAEVRLAVRLTPRATRNGLDGVAAGPDGRTPLLLRVAAPPPSP